MTEARHIPLNAFYVYSFWHAIACPGDVRSSCAFIALNDVVANRIGNHGKNNRDINQKTGVMIIESADHP
ncbi:hypothetical protein D3C86_2013510 [compost metagenome]